MNSISIDRVRLFGVSLFRVHNNSFNNNRFVCLFVETIFCQQSHGHRNFHTENIESVSTHAAIAILLVATANCASAENHNSRNKAKNEYTFV